ncbi:MAG TPA: serine protease [Casimicrobiaceae bacterium]
MATRVLLRTARSAAPIRSLRTLRTLALLPVCLLAAPPAGAGDVSDTIARVKQSVVAVGTIERSRTPPFQFRGTGFAVGDGTTIVTNAHVLPPFTDPARGETLAILVPGTSGESAQARDARVVAIDSGVDLALVHIGGPALPALKLHDSTTVREGQVILMTGFPIGAVLGPFAATHRGMIAAITPIAIPQGRAADLDPAVVRRLTSGSFPVFQLDATAYPGNSGSPIYDPASGEVLGIVNMVFVKGTKETALSQPSGITYAVPARHLEALLRHASQEASSRK